MLRLPPVQHNGSEAFAHAPWRIGNGEDSRVDPRGYLVSDEHGEVNLEQVDVAVIGSGIAGLFLAVECARSGLKSSGCYQEGGFYVIYKLGTGRDSRSTGPQ